MLPYPVSPDRQTIFVRTSAVGFSSGYRWADRRSSWGQLLWASRGAISATTGQRVWIIPAGRALWIPPDTANDVVMQGRGILRSLFLSPDRAGGIGGKPALLHIPPLLRELIRRAFEETVLDDQVDRHRLVAKLLWEELRDAMHAPPEPMDLPLPSDTRALRAADVMLARPGASLAELELPRAVGASRRTLERLFSVQTGLSLGEWRQRNALMHGLRQLADGMNVTQAAISAGYAGTSAFVFACRRLTGVTPGILGGSRAGTQRAEGAGVPVPSASP